MKCSRCQQDAPSDAEFCPACGAVLVLSCRRCGTANAPDHKYCKKCGQPLLTTEAPLAESARSPGAPERRQLTVMFCDLVGSTDLAARLDPEILREIVRSYQEVCAAVIDRFDGHIAQYLGDGLLVYFGYPVAHEDDPQRAGRAALGIFAAMETLNARLHRERDVKLALRQAHRTAARFNEAELHRLRGELLLRRAVPADAEAEACFRQALATARGQQAKSLELRAAMSLNRLLSRLGKSEDARRLLAEIYDGFTEGFDTGDLKDAAALVQELRSG